MVVVGHTDSLACSLGGGGDGGHDPPYGSEESKQENAQIYSNGTNDL